MSKPKTLGTPNGYYDFLDDHYSYIRQFAPQFLATLPFTSHEADDPLLEAVATLRQLDTANQRKLPDDVSMDFVPDRWRRFVHNNGQPSLFERSTKDEPQSQTNPGFQEQSPENLR